MAPRALQVYPPGVWALLTFALGCSDSRDPDASAAGDGGGRASGPGGAGTAVAGSSGGNAGGAGSRSGDDGSSGTGNAAGAAGRGTSSPLPERLARYHRADTDRSLRFELDVVEGLSPYPSSIDYLTTFVGRALDKPDGVFFDADEMLEPAGSEHVWTFAELDAFARAHARDDENAAVSIHVLLVDGQYDPGAGEGTVLGLAWGQRHIALFQDAIRSGCSGGLLGALSAESCEIAERNVWAHEIGHVIGLVDNGLAQQLAHRDADHGRHDVSDACLMYWAYDGPAAFDSLLSRLSAGQSPDADFCANCWADLSAARR